MTRFSNARFAQSPNYWPGRQGHRITAIVIHSTAGFEPGVLEWFSTPSSSVSAHYVVNRDGSVICCVDEDDSAWHAGVVTADSIYYGKGNLNVTTIGIEHENDGTNSLGLTPAQMAASVRLIADIRRRHGNLPFIPHHAINSGHAGCPGPRFPLAELDAATRQNSATTTMSGGGRVNYKQRHVSQYENWNDGTGLNGHMNCGEASWARWLIAADYPLFLTLISQGLTFTQAVGRLMAHVRQVATGQAEHTGEAGTLVVQMEHYAQAAQIPGWSLAPAEKALWGSGVIRPWTIFLARAWQLTPAQYPVSFLGSNLDLPDHYILKLPGRADGPLFNDPLAWDSGQADCVYTVASVREAVAGTSCLMLPDPSTIAWSAVGDGGYRAHARPAPTRPAPTAARWRVRAGVPLHVGPTFGPGALEDAVDLTLEQHGQATPHWTPLFMGGHVRWALTSLLEKVG